MVYDAFLRHPAPDNSKVDLVRGIVPEQFCTLPGRFLLRREEQNP